MMNLYCPMSGIDQEIGYSLLSIFDWPLIAGGYVNEKYWRKKHEFHKTVDRFEPLDKEPSFFPSLHI